MQHSPFPKMQPGSSTPSIPASSWNVLMDVAAWYQREILHKQISTPKPKPFNRCNCVLVRNDTGGHLTVGNVIGLGGVLYDPTVSVQREFYRSEPIFLGAALNGNAVTYPYRNDIGIFGILQEPIADGSVGYAAIDGIVSCTIAMQYQSHRFADIAGGGGSNLGSNEYGGAEIINVEDQDEDAGDWEAGDKLALVRLGCFHNPLIPVVWVGAFAVSSSITAYTIGQPVPAADPTTDPDARELTIANSMNCYGDSITLTYPEYGIVQFNRENGQFELLATSKQYPLPPSGFTGSGTYTNFAFTDGKATSAS